MQQTRDFFSRGDQNCWRPPRVKDQSAAPSRDARQWKGFEFCVPPFLLSFWCVFDYLHCWGVGVQWAQWFWTCATQGLDQRYMNCVMLNEKCGDTQCFSHTSQLSLEKWGMGWDLDILYSKRLALSPFVQIKDGLLNHEFWEIKSDWLHVLDLAQVFFLTGCVSSDVLIWYILL
jgi:hypothetical protein